MIVAAAIVALALRRPRSRESRAPDPRLDTRDRGAGRASPASSSRRSRRRPSCRRTLVRAHRRAEQALGETLTRARPRPPRRWAGIGERLTVIDEAQKNITALSGQVVALAGHPLRQAGARRLRPGADGSDHRRPAVARRSMSSSTRSRTARGPTASSALPNVKAVIVVDSKFPLEAFEALRGAPTTSERKAAAARLRTDVQKHVERHRRRNT